MSRLSTNARIDPGMFGERHRAKIEAALRDGDRQAATFQAIAGTNGGHQVSMPPVNVAPLAAADPETPRRAREMNMTETRYSLVLKGRKALGEIPWWGYEVMNLRLADNTWYRPDFIVLLPGGHVEVHEVKGAYVREDAWLKVKMAAEIYPYRFRLCKWASGQWSISLVPGLVDDIERILPIDYRGM